MDLTGRALLLLSVAVFFRMADSQNLSTYDGLEDLLKSVKEDMDSEISKNRRISMIRDTLRAKQWEDSGIGTDRKDVVWLAAQYMLNLLPFGDDDLRLPTSFTEDALTSKSTSPFVAPISTAASVTEKQTTTSMPKSASFIGAPTISKVDYSNVDSLTQKQAVTSKSGSSSAVSWSSTVAYSTADPVTEKHYATSTYTSTSSSADPSSSTVAYSTVDPVTEKHYATSTSSSADLLSSTASYSTADSVTDEQSVASTYTSTSSADPSGSTADYSTKATTERSVTDASMSASSSTEPSGGGSYDLPNVKHPYRVGSMRGIPGEHFPDYTDIPITDFSCSDKPAVPGFYADLDTGCQVFHVCWFDRRETFLCPVGTTFNQAILACDYWYSNNCSLAPQYFSVNMGDTGLSVLKDKNHETTSSMIEDYLESSTVEPSEASTSGKELETVSSAILFVSKFLPVKAKVTIYPESKGLHTEAVSLSVDDGKEGSTVEDIPDADASVSSSDFHTSMELETPASSEDIFDEIMKEAIYQAHEDLSNYFAPLLEVEPLAKQIEQIKKIYERSLVVMLEEIENKSFKPNRINKTLPESVETHKAYAEKWRHTFVNVTIGLASLLKKIRGWATEDPRLATVAPVTEHYSTEDPKLATVVPVVEHYSTEEPRVATVVPVSGHYSTEEPRVATVVPVSGHYSTEDPRLATVAPLTKLNPRFIIKPAATKLAEAYRKSTVHVKKTHTKPPMQRNSKTMSKKTKGAMLLNYLNFLKLKADILYGLLK